MGVDVREELYDRMIVNCRIFVLELLAYKYNESLHLYRERVERDRIQL